MIGLLKGSAICKRKGLNVPVFKGMQFCMPFRVAILVRKESLNSNYNSRRY